MWALVVARLLCETKVEKLCTIRSFLSLTQSSQRAPSFACEALLNGAGVEYALQAKWESGARTQAALREPGLS